MELDKELMKDSKQRPLTQGLFLELGYNTKFAMFTLKDEDFFYEGQFYPSLKKLYLGMEDPIEYEFATKYLLGWSHWERICNNKLMSPHIEEWRKELSLKLQYKGFREMIKKAETSPMAAKWLADRGWEVKEAGRPSKAEKISASKVEEKFNSEFGADIIRLQEGS